MLTGLEAIFVGAAAKEAIGPIANLVKKLGGDASDRLLVEYARCFDGHVKTAYDRCSNVKNIIYKDRSANLKEKYVNVNFSDSDKIVSDDSVIDQALEGDRILISGTAGAGKTMFMKWMTLSIIESIHRHKMIPLFMELRYVSKDNISKGLINYIVETTSDSANRVSLDKFKIGLESGQFIIILDAIDEIKIDLKEHVVGEIRNLIRDFPGCPVVLSSRQDDYLESVQDLAVLKTIPMDKDQIISVIEKIDYDESVKLSLIDKLNRGMFNDHKEFLSNPLLASIMLLTFDYSADIPNKLTSFYRQAFEVLYQRHDAAKGAYKRGHYAGLPLDEYEKIFATFCFDSFLDSKVEFSDSELLSYFRDACEYCNIDSPVELVVKDSMESVCVIQKEGLDNVFAHRSFQEYFTALFLSKYSGDDIGEIIDGVARYGANQNVPKMLMELAPQLIEEKWIGPKIKNLLSKINRHSPNSESGARKIFAQIFSSIAVAPDNGRVIGYSITFGRIDHAAQWLSVIEKCYDPRKKLISPIFYNNPDGIFGDLEDYLAKPGAIKPSLESILSRMEPDQDDEEEDASSNSLNLTITQADMGWLMDSKIPELLADIRNACRSLNKEISLRSKARAASMSKFTSRRRFRSSKVF